jgi:hypothetical protein
MDGDDDDKTRAVAIVWGILSPHFDNWPREPEIEPDNIIWLENYRLH